VFLIKFCRVASIVYLKSLFHKNWNRHFFEKVKNHPTLLGTSVFHFSHFFTLWGPKEKYSANSTKGFLNEKDTQKSPLTEGKIKKLEVAKFRQ